MTAGHARDDDELARARRFVAREDTGVLLDLDGTLVDSEPIHQAAFAAYFALRGWTVEASVLEHFIGRRAAEVFVSLEGPWTGEDPDLLTAAIIAELVAMNSRPEPLPQVPRILEFLLLSGKPVCIVTSATKEWTQRAIDALALPAELRSALKTVTAEDCSAGKPDPTPFRNGAVALGMSPQLCLAVEDSPAGIRSARDAAVEIVVAVSTTHSVVRLEDAKPDLVVDGLGALVPLSR